MINKLEKEFLEQSNYIEREYSSTAFEDAKKSWEFIKRVSFPMRLDLIKKIHRRLMKRLNYNIAGKFRKIQVGVMVNGEFKEAIHWGKIKSEIEQLCFIIPKTEQEIKDWHIKFEKIHPFEDGNGRTGRIIMNFQRLRAGLKLLIIHEGEEQLEYYKWFR